MMNILWYRLFQAMAMVPWGVTGWIGVGIQITGLVLMVIYAWLERREWGRQDAIRSRHQF